MSMMSSSDDDDLPLFRAYARSTDPDTSHEAAESVDVSKLEGLVLSVLKMIYPRDANWREVSEHPIITEANVDRQSVSPRFKRLEEKGLAERTGERRMGWKKSQETWRYKPQ